MTNEQIISKMKDDMKMRGFSHWTEESYLGKTKDIMKYFRKPMEEVEIEELRNFLLKHLRDVNDKIRMYKKWNIKMYKDVQC